MRNANKEVEARIQEKLSLIMDCLADGTPKTNQAVKDATGITYLNVDHLTVFNLRLRNQNIPKKLKTHRATNPNSKNAAHCLWWTLVDR